MSLFWLISLVLLIVIGYLLYLGIKWFMSPLLISMNDGIILKEHSYMNYELKKMEIFPNIHDIPTKTMTLVIPAYNESKRIHLSLDPSIKYFKERSNNDNTFTWEIIVVNDGSKDNTKDVVLNNYCKKYSSDELRLLSYDVNQGKGYAVQQGMLHSRGGMIIFADADGASEITHFKRLQDTLYETINCQNNNDLLNNKYKLNGIIIGSRAHLQKNAEAKRTLFRNFFMYGFHFVVKYIGGIKNIKDTQCGFKLFTRNACKLTILNQKIRRWAFDVEILFIAQILNIKIKEVSIKWNEIPDGNLTPLKAAFNMFREIILLRCCHTFGIWYANLKKN